MTAAPARRSGGAVAGRAIPPRVTVIRAAEVSGAAACGVLAPILRLPCAFAVTAAAMRRAGSPPPWAHDRRVMKMSRGAPI